MDWWMASGYGISCLAGYRKSSVNAYSDNGSREQTERIYTDSQKRMASYFWPNW